MRGKCVDISMWVVCGVYGLSVCPSIHLDTTAKIIRWYQCMDGVLRVWCIGASVYVSGYQCVASIRISVYG